MTVRIQTQFGTNDGEKRYGRAVADLIRAERHDLAQESLVAGLASLRAPLAELCLDALAGDARLTGWETLQQMIFRPLPGGRPVHGRRTGPL